MERVKEIFTQCFKPCYKWNTFNTNLMKELSPLGYSVLNLVISGIPSIQPRPKAIIFPSKMF